MKATYTSADGRFTFTLDGSDQKSIFREVAALQEVFEEPCCGACKGKNTRFVVREVDKFSYFEKKCMVCGARLAYGHSQDMKTLFPKRKIEVNGEGVYDTRTRGWAKWAGKKEEKK